MCRCRGRIHPIRSSVSIAVSFVEWPQETPDWRAQHCLHSAASERAEAPKSKEAPALVRTMPQAKSCWARSFAANELLPTMKDAWTLVVLPQASMKLCRGSRSVSRRQGQGLEGERRSVRHGQPIFHDGCLYVSDLGARIDRTGSLELCPILSFYRRDSSGGWKFGSNDAEQQQHGRAAWDVLNPASTLI